jgi:serine/threonine-protein kinase
MSADLPSSQPDWLDVHKPGSGRYVLGPILGMGGAGEVREAWDAVLCRTVALKVLRKMEPVGLIRFMHEAQIQSRIVHPNICRIYDVDNSGGIPKIAMQLVRGPTLARVAHELTVKEVVVLLAQVAEAIHAAHRLNLIHRDLKPSNILLERSPEGRWVPFVCDFGLAMALDEPSLTLGPALLGTPAFMAPEQRRGERRLVGPATDIFALGATLHYALFGDAPVSDAGAVPIRRYGVFPPQRSPDPDLPRDLETILRKCLELDPALRYPSAQSLAEDLWLFADGAPIHARPVGALEHRWRQLRQYRMLVLAVLLAACVVLTGRLVEKGRLVREQRRRESAERFFTLEAADMEKELRLEKMMPIHDLRPAYARLAARMDGIRRRMTDLGPVAQASGHYALGHGLLLLRDYAGAQKELEGAWDGGFQAPDVAWNLARSMVGASYMAANQAIFADGLQPPVSSDLVRRLKDLLQHSTEAQGGTQEYAEALVAFAGRDYRRAASRAHDAFKTHPWQAEAATLESLARSSQGRQRYDAGDLQGAEADFREAMAAAGRFLEIGHSDEFTYHAYFIAARELTFLLATQGRLDLAWAESLRARCRQALLLDPRQQELQDDYVLLSLVREYRLRNLGRDSGPELQAALAFLDTWARPPLPVELRADRMLLHWRLAERCFKRGGDPGPDLAEALKDLGHTTGFRHNDHLVEVLNFKARVELSRGLDPRPTLDVALDRMRPLLEHDASWPLCESAAETWLIRAEWEAAHGQDAQGSLQRSRALVDMALQVNGRSGPAHALKGLVLALEARIQPQEGPLQLPEARNQLRLAQALAPSGRLQDQLRQALRAVPGSEAGLNEGTFPN